MNPNFLSPDEIGSLYRGQLSDQEVANLYNTAAARNDFSMFMPKQVATVASNPATSIPSAWPTFRNEIERNLAVDTGAYDPTYATPIAKAAAIAAGKSAETDAIKFAASQRQAFPLTNDLSPEGTLMAQLAGDRGDTKRILQSLQNIDPQSQLMLPPEKRTSLMPYYSEGGIGGAPSMEAMKSKLDLNLFSDPEFSRLYASNPKKAAFVYESLVGRPLETDLTTHTDITKARGKLGTDFVSRALASGAKWDPETGKWMIWQRSEPEATGFGIGGAANPVTKLIEATPEQTQYFKDYYKNVTGYGHPTMPVSQARQMELTQRDQADYEWLGAKSREMYDKRIAKEEQVKGQPLTRQEKRVVLDNILSMGPQDVITKAAEMGTKFGEYLGIDNYQTDTDREAKMSGRVAPGQAFFIQKMMDMFRK